MNVELKETTLKAIHSILIKELQKQLEAYFNGESYCKEYDLAEIVWELETYSNRVLPKTIYK